MQHGLKDVMLRGTARAITLWTLGFAALHSILASQIVKDRFKHAFGEATVNGVYRACFNGFSLLTFAGLLLRFSRLPDREIYHVRRPWSLPLRMVQALAILMLLDANIRIGLGRMSGTQGLWQWHRGKGPIEQNPAQGPQLEGDLAFRTGGSFQLSRHPNNLAPLLLWLAQPRMTARLLTFTLVSAAYLVAGSLHEERRLLLAYGKAYDRYRKGVPFYLPWPRQWRWRR